MSCDLLCAASQRIAFSDSALSRGLLDWLQQNAKHTKESSMVLSPQSDRSVEWPKNVTLARSAFFYCSSFKADRDNIQSLYLYR